MKKSTYYLLLALLGLGSCSKEEIDPVIPSRKPQLLHQGRESFDFSGYRVDPSLKTDRTYWSQVPILTDIITYRFNKNIDPLNPDWNGFTTQQIAGDFNLDGWMDVFNPGSGRYNGKVVDYFSWWIWNPQTKTFDTWNLFTNVEQRFFGQNQYKSLPVFLNDDEYMDIVLFDTYDEALPLVSYEPLRIILSDGKGGYELKEISLGFGKYLHSGDIGDIDNDSIEDIVLCTGEEVIIGKGTKQFPYFQEWKRLKSNLVSRNCYYASIKDIDSDGLKDLVLGCNGDSGNENRILFQDTPGEFSRIVLLPRNNGLNLDYLYDDFNGDGKIDILGLTNYFYNSWDLTLYEQTPEGFRINRDRIEYSNKERSRWKARFIFQDFNGDGSRDVAYIDPHNFYHSLKDKTVFVREGDKLVERDIYPLEPFLRQIRKN
jgi:hypothetical protein